jgi:GTP-binding protein EngB required for normal cell division
MIGLNEAQIRKLQVTFKYLDELLGDALLNLLPTAGDYLFGQYVQDATEQQRKILGDYLKQFRHVIRHFLDESGIAVPPPHIGSLWAFRTALNFARIALAEMTPERLRSNGALDEKAAGDVAALIAELDTVLADMSAYLEAGLGGDISARLARLDATSDEVSLLRDIAEIVDRHGWVELRRTVSNLLDKLERDQLEVAFFGRVSSGKSSLLNFFLDADVLPTGITPITAVPTRIVHGLRPRATVTFARSETRTVDLDGLGDYVSEEGNPNNSRHVLDVVVEVPAARLKDGVCLVDTPGLGSLAASGAAQTLAYLPRCDIGVLLIASGGPLVEEDITVARSILETGADLIVVLSKADMLGDREREQMLAYLHETFDRALGLSTTIDAVSTAAGHAELARRWLDEILTPSLGRQREILTTSLRRKIGALRERVLSMLRHASGKDLSSEPRAIAAAKASGALWKAHAAIEAARKELFNIASDIGRTPDQMLDDAAVSLSDAWDNDDDDGAGAKNAVSRAMAEGADRLHRRFEATLQVADRSAQLALAEAQGASTGATMPATLPRHAGSPLFDPSRLLREATFPKPRLAGVLGQAAQRKSARALLDQKLRPALDDIWASYSDALARWAQAQLAELQRAFASASAEYEVEARLSNGGAPQASERSSQADADIDRLSRWMPQPSDMTKP